ncbi:MAG: T9SS type A sorting domain-containing protein [Bacteroidia bacterium]|nr:T9SS type A sorting domain-containing protein [Bacteroidia bacterium]
MKKIILFFCLFTQFGWAQIDIDFFPQFQAFAGNPIIKYGDGFAGAAWNDPCVLKINGQYIMYLSAAQGISGVNKVKIYRLVSNDGYAWSLSPSSPVIENDSGTYYAGGAETPSVVYKNGVYHLYLTTYPFGNNGQDFAISHGTSADGISWTMDPNTILESDGSASWKGYAVAEPGAVVYRDSIYVFFTAIGTQGASVVQGIGLIKSADGTNFTAPEQKVTMPQSVYPSANGWYGLSTPSALAINDSLYLFTDVARVINGTWTQVALHQFKANSAEEQWYADDAPIHTMQDFSWTNGSFYSELRSITPLLEEDGRLRIWYAGNRLADVSGSDTTYHVVFDSLGNIHPHPDYWGIGTSEYQFPNTTNINAFLNAQHSFRVYPNPAKDYVIIQAENAEEYKNIFLQNTLGQIQTIPFERKEKTLFVDVSSLKTGVYFFVLNGRAQKIIKQ